MVVSPKPTRISKYTLDIVIQRGKEIHGNKYNYSKIKSEDINGRNSKILVICNTCNYEWYPSIHDHITHKVDVLCVGTMLRGI